MKRLLPAAERNALYGRAVFYGLLGLLFLLPLEPVVDTGLGFNWVHVWGLLLSAVWMGQLVLVERRTPRLDRAVWPFLLYVGWALLSISWAQVPVLSIRAAVLSVWLAVLFVLVVDQIDSRTRLKGAVTALLAGGVASILLAYVTGSFAEAHQRLVLVPWQHGVTAYGLPLALVMSAFGAIALCAGGRLRGVALLVYLSGLYPVTAVGLRGAILAIVVALGAVTVLTDRAARKVPLAVFLIVLLLGSFKIFERITYLPQQLVDHITLSDVVGPHGTVRLRLDIWRIAVAAFRDVPVLGLGLQQFGLASAKHAETGYRPLGPHNSYLGTLVELGIPGLLLFLCGQSMIMIYLLRGGRRLTRDEDFVINALLLAMVVAALTEGLFVTMVRSKIAWMVQGLIIAMHRQRR